MTEIEKGPDQLGLEELPEEEVKLHATRLYYEFLDTLLNTPELINLVIRNFFWGKRLTGAHNHPVALFKRGNKYYNLEFGQNAPVSQGRLAGGMEITMADNAHDAYYASGSSEYTTGNWIVINLSTIGFSQKSPLIKNEYGFSKKIYNTQLALEKTEEVLGCLKTPVDALTHESSSTEEIIRII